MLSKELQKQIYKLMKEELFPIIRFDSELLGVISSVWDIYEKESTGEDRRYNVLGDEIEKHYILNEDWSDDKLFISILNIYGNSDKFILFLEQLLDIYYGDDFSKFYKSLNILLSSNGFFIEEKKENGIRKVLISDVEYKVQKIEDRSIPFFICNSEIYNAVEFYEKNIQLPEQNNCFVLTFNYLWNDFSIKTRFKLYYLNEKRELNSIGEVKIMACGELDTSEIIKKKFYSLSDEFCSLGQNLSYYSNFFKLFKNKAYIYLRELRDVSYYSAICKKIEENMVFKDSLIRENSAEQALRLGRYVIYGRDIKNAFSFSYNFIPKYDKEEIFPQTINFDFKYDCELYERIFGIIGENGTGKTTLINSIIKSLTDKGKQKDFNGLPPLFSSVVVVSFSPFDLYSIDVEDKDSVIDYNYCGILKKKDEFFSIEEQAEKLAFNINEILRRDGIIRRHWYRIMSDVIQPDVLDKMLPDEVGEGNVVKQEILLETYKKMSSGETMFFYSMSAIMANIRRDSLIFFDEPEQHLHPRAVTKLIVEIYKLLDSFESYAIITTHSPFIIRELISKNVYVFKKENSMLNVLKIGIESLGEDVSVLSEIVFDNMRDTKSYENFIEKVVSKNRFNFDDSVKALTSGDKTLSLNARLLIQSLIDKNNNETFR